MAAAAATAASPASPAQGSSAVGGQAWAQAVGECPLKREDFEDTTIGKAAFAAGCHLWTVRVSD